MRLRRWIPWLALVVVAAAALAVGARGDGGPRSPDERARSIAERVRCPTCRSQSAAESDAPASRAIREEIGRRVAAGQSDAEILAYFADRFGKDVILQPEGTGIAAVVWALPVAVVVAGLAGLAVAFRRWRPRPVEPSEDDRRLVAEALGKGGGP
jgi:cytochrome c-type biogenesis protein CcmH